MQRSVRGAFGDAVRELEESGARLGGDGRGPVPVLPLVLGGDDMVAMCEGRWALPFARAYLRALERRTASDEWITQPLRRCGRPPGLAAAAGVALTKPHFPFQIGHALAYDLMNEEAKQVKARVPGRPCSGLAFHVVFDSSGVELKRLRAQATAVDGSRLVAQPYVVSEVSEGNGWVRGRRWQDLVDRVAALGARGQDGERRLPATQVHDLREGLHLGRAVADARFANLLSRYGARGLEDLAAEPGSVFWCEEPGGTPITGLLDAMDALEFLAVPGGAR
jgi:hypothetical protein